MKAAARSRRVWETNECSSCPPRQRHSITLHYCHTSKLCNGAGNKSSYITKNFSQTSPPLLSSIKHNKQSNNQKTKSVRIKPPRDEMRGKAPLLSSGLPATDCKHFSLDEMAHLSGRSTRVHWRWRWWRWRSAGDSAWRLSSPASTGTPAAGRLWAAGCIRPGCAWAGRGADGFPG